MTKEQFAEFFVRQGRRVLSRGGYYWYEIFARFFMRIPFHEDGPLAAGELERLLMRKLCLGLRYAQPAAPGEDVRGLWACKGPAFDFPSLQSKARNQTRRGLENCVVREVQPRELGGANYRLVRDTLQRQRRAADALSQAEWERIVLAASTVPGFTGWLAEANGQIVSMALAANVEGVYSVLHQYSATSGHHLYPNNALIFSLTKRALSQADVQYVSYGLRSLEETPSLDRFKADMGFREIPLCQHVVFHPAMRLALGWGGARVVRWMGQHHPSSDVWRKGAGVLELIWKNEPSAAPREVESPQQDVATFRWQPKEAELKPLAEEIAIVHLQAFPFSFLTSLGLQFLVRFYRAVLRRPDLLCFLVRVGDRLAGFAVGVKQPRRFYGNLFLRYGWSLLLSILPMVLVRPGLLRDIWHRVKYGIEQPFPHECKLLSIGVSPLVRGKGYGRELIQLFLDAASQPPLSGAWLETDAEHNDPVNALYQRSGFHLYRSMITPAGKHRNIYVSWPLAKAAGQAE